MLIALDPLQENPSQEMLVCTVGELRVWPGASNVIAGSTQLSIDIRAKYDDLRLHTVEEVIASIEMVCAQRGVSCQIKRTHDAGAVLSDNGMIQRARAAIRAARPVVRRMLGGSEGGEEGENMIPVIVSGAGHDGLAMAEVTKVGTTGRGAGSSSTTVQCSAFVVFHVVSSKRPSGFMHPHIAYWDACILRSICL